MMKVISLGLGVQSTALYFLSSTKMIERADHAVFADPGAELPRTYEILEMLQEWAKYNDGIPIHVINERNLLQDILKKQNSQGARWASIPAFSESGGMVRRQCTGEYKIQPVIKKVRELHGLKPRQRMPKTEMWLGITLDEIQRMKESQLPRIDYKYPLIDQRMSRGDCMKVFKRFSFPIPPKSSCTFCPYHSDKNWKEIKDNHPKEWEQCVEVDNAIRDSSKRGLKDKMYLHRSLIPLERIEFADQQELFMCEEGFCGL
tara:strand:- start:147 stop:926 length:780 start_codon:yes stop_codon:yes gene_type:complete